MGGGLGKTEVALSRVRKLEQLLWMDTFGFVDTRFFRLAVALDETE
jgi:hypothetical protein